MLLRLDLPGLFEAILEVTVIYCVWKEAWLFKEPLLSIKFPNLYQLEYHRNVLISERVKMVGGGINLFVNWLRQPNNDAEEADVNRLTATVMAFYSGRGMTSGWIPGSFR
ncbi:hypothetical protein HanRHA438_Chr12g0574471 [Helianthus annuus]|nr:hypothetical protein HanHA300_Chr12g0462101 [Helianthus annuus]KAJ0506923.1 hypothetical protein HanHA89_Chr12g0487521 [Helianthus annuus]KAJ0676559.1 hypothetical protein HanLR1_Chr12g0464121 [Helianthus annuus]KAJ0679761.1 hypothetical protein HanOQP8_Chr12g0463261 [Helianthus annuus]KAJ0868427.1 hypothetical protein HanRHA438_Chr12g0574471 [Helianthus annuus]